MHRIVIWFGRWLLRRAGGVRRMGSLFRLETTHRNTLLLGFRDFVQQLDHNEFQERHLASAVSEQMGIS